MLGNLLDNACKWARTRVVALDARRSRTAHTADRLAILVDDDGPGLAAPMRDAVLQRGVRADEAAPGSGFGLAIVREIAEVYGGSIVLDAAPRGACARGCSCRPRLKRYRSKRYIRGHPRRSR